jgi:predicted DNA-binding transcriptional regulator YafY
MFTTPEALALVMAVIERRGSADPADPVERALGKIIRVLPEPVAKPAEAVRSVSARGPDPGAASPSPETTAVIVQSCASRRRLRLGYRMGPGERVMEVDPWAVVVRHGRWYLPCWSHTKNARRVLRVDRVTAVDVREWCGWLPAFMAGAADHEGLAAPSCRVNVIVNVIQSLVSREGH